MVQYHQSNKGSLELLYNRVFNKKSTPTSCGSCLRDMIEKLNKVYEEYKSDKNVKKT